ncbi:SEC-C domain-containing protein [Blastopirellula sp. JC732]|uniref:SEC-C domain-containing protein n=2 Tax=Blastopirellula sediminis TaxID=2894196 RepID=A0A9X1MR01_9BACT|nr:SEC-C domain-containing protein [Blastopirellula sediminis]MCC9630842.1 SEC-C domain-containing protein [Blastopirellula sediminis]
MARQHESSEGSTGTEPEVVEPIRNAGKRVGRNSPCPCGSGKKYKDCHMGKDRGVT